MVVRVVKTDGGVEEYVHTKVLLCIDNALCEAQQWEAGLSQELADAVTAFIYCRKLHHIRSAEVLAMVKVVLTETGFGEAAARLDERHHRRNLARRRTELVEAEVDGPDDAEAMRAASQASQWSKSLIAGHIERTYGLERHSARAAAGRVEERVLAMGMSRVWSGLVRQIIAAEASLTMKAHDLLRDAGVRGAAMKTASRKRSIQRQCEPVAAEAVGAAT